MTVERLFIGVWADVVIESLSNVVAGVVVVLECVVRVSYFREVVSDVMIKMLAVCIGDEVMIGVNVNVSAGEIIALEFPASMW